MKQETEDWIGILVIGLPVIGIPISMLVFIGWMLFFK